MTTGLGPVAGAEVALALRGVVLLAGHVGRNPFAEGVARPVIDLPVDRLRTVLDVWGEHLAEFARCFDLPRLDVCVAVSRHDALPRLPPPSRRPRVEFSVVHDASDYRGTAGVVRDCTRGYADRDLMVVVPANQVQREPMSDTFSALSRGGEGVAVVPYAGGEFAAMFLLRCGRLRDVSDVGFVDMKEQALPSARGHAPLFVARRAPGAALPLRTREEYLRALRAVHADMDAVRTAPSPSDPFAETWETVFEIVEPGAQVSPGAVLQNSVVLARGRVEEGAVVSDCVVCPGGVVRRGRCVVDSVVAGGRR